MRAYLLVCVKKTVNETPDLLDSLRDEDICIAEESGSASTFTQGHTPKCVRAGADASAYARTHTLDE